MIEMQFYLMFPDPGADAAPARRALYLTLIAFPLLLRAIVFALTGTVHNLGYFSIFGALDLFLIGCLAGVYHSANARAAHLRRVVAGGGRRHQCRHLFHASTRRPVPRQLQAGAQRQQQRAVDRLADAARPPVGGPGARLSQGQLRSALLEDLGLPRKISYSLYAWHTIACMLAVAYIAPILGSAYLTGLVVVLPFAVRRLGAQLLPDRVPLPGSAHPIREGRCSEGQADAASRREYRSARRRRRAA